MVVAIENERVSTVPLVSVIVPVYKVEPYLPECVESILAQTYGNLEVILVDDGSPDGCPALCDACAARDARVRVIHKSNGGLSDARNAGLDVARGDYIGFVDSDDKLDPHMYEALVGVARTADADIVACGYYVYRPEQGIPYKTGGAAERRDLARREAVLLLLEDDELQNYVWNKLFAAHLWNGVRFPVGQQFEDVNTTYKLFERARGAVLLPEPLYYYRTRADGIVKSRTLKGEIDCVEANLQRCEVLWDRYPEARGLMADGVLRAMLRVWPLVWEGRAGLDAPLRAQLDRFAAFARGHLGASGLPDRLGSTGRMGLKLLPYAKPWAWCLSWGLYRLYRTQHTDA